MAKPKRNLGETVKAMQARKQQSGRAPAKTRAVRPTQEREAMNATQSAGMAVRVVPVIDTLKARGTITEDQHAALKHYRDTADLANRSEIKSNLDREIRAVSDGKPNLAITIAKSELSRLDAILGDLKRICVAVCRDDMSLTQWACQEYGARECTKKGKTVMVPRGNKQGHERIEWERHCLIFAAGRIMKAGY